MNRSNPPRPITTIAFIYIFPILMVRVKCIVSSFGSWWTWFTPAWSLYCCSGGKLEAHSSPARSGV